MEPPSNLVQTEFNTYLTKQYLLSEDIQRLDFLAYVLGVTVTIKRTYFNSEQVELVTVPDLDKPSGSGQASDVEDVAQKGTSHSLRSLSKERRW